MPIITSNQLPEIVAKRQGYLILGGCPNSVRHDACLLVGTIGLADILQTSEAALQIY
jgi:hypothetical protein